MEITGLVFVSLVARLALTVYGKWQDQTMAVKFTDIDYHVFNDATEYVTQARSPYLRATYRYTPLLAQILLPNILISSSFGKLLFIVFDVLTGYLIYKITLSGGSSSKMANICAAVWLLNPLPMTVSCRGNAESIMTFLVLLCLKLMQDKRVAIAGFIYAISVHVKIYPVTYALPIYLLLGGDYCKFDITMIKEKGFYGVIKLLWPNKDRLVFILTAGATLASLTAVYYYWYGWDFLYHTYLYHITRKDIRHNFSVYFYMLYQQSGEDSSFILGLLSFIPQVILLVLFSVRYYKHPAMAFFLNTFAFVTFNKVCTSQYFLWYLCMVPLLLPNLSRISMVKAASSVILWFAGQGVWLLPAYYLEFKGQNTFLYIWIAGLVFFLINCYVLYVVIDNYTQTPLATTSHGGRAENKIENKIIDDQNKFQFQTDEQKCESKTQNKKNETAIDKNKLNIQTRNRVRDGLCRDNTGNKINVDDDVKIGNDGNNEEDETEEIVKYEIWTRSRAWRRSHVTKHKFL